MSLRNHGLLFSNCRRVGFLPRSSLPSTAASVSPSSLQRTDLPARLRLQLRVLRTATKETRRPSTSLINWSWTAHRRRHIPPSGTVMATQTQTRGHAGHHHHGAHDNAYLLSSNKKDAGVRITRIGLYVNLGMAVGKGLGGYVFHSQGRQAHCVHIAATNMVLTDLQPS